MSTRQLINFFQLKTLKNYQLICMQVNNTSERESQRIRKKPS